MTEETLLEALHARQLEHRRRHPLRPYRVVGSLAYEGGSGVEFTLGTFSTKSKASARLEKERERGIQLLREGRAIAYECWIEERK